MVYRAKFWYFHKGHNHQDTIHQRGWDIFSRRDLAEWSERLTANVKVATAMGSIPTSFDTVESEGRQMKQC